MTTLPDHPDLRCIEDTGYPNWNQPLDFYCDVCGILIEDDDVFDDYGHEFLCERCLKNLHRKEW